MRRVSHLGNVKIDKPPVGLFLLFKQKTAYDMRISDWSSDVCSSDLMAGMVKRLERDTQVELVLRNRTRELGLEIVGQGAEIGRASLRGRVCQYVEISVVARFLKQKYSSKYTVHTLTHIGTVKRRHRQYQC